MKIFLLWDETANVEVEVNILHFAQSKLLDIRAQWMNFFTHFLCGLDNLFTVEALLFGQNSSKMRL